MNLAVMRTTEEENIDDTTRRLGGNTIFRLGEPVMSEPNDLEDGPILTIYT